MRRVRRWLTPANVLAGLALFVALEGTGWAGQVIGHGAVGTVQLKGEAVTAGKIAKGAVTKSKLAKGAVGSEAIARGAVGNEAIAAGTIAVDRLATGVVGGVAGSKISTVTVPADGAAQQLRHGRDRDLPGRAEGFRRRLELGPRRVPAV